MTEVAVLRSALFPFHKAVLFCEAKFGSYLGLSSLHQCKHFFSPPNHVYLLISGVRELLKKFIIISWKHTLTPVHTYTHTMQDIIFWTTGRWRSLTKVIGLWQCSSWSFSNRYQMQISVLLLCSLPWPRHAAALEGDKASLFASTHMNLPLLQLAIHAASSDKDTSRTRSSLLHWSI